MTRPIKFRAWEPDEEAKGGGTMWVVRNLEWHAGGVGDAYLGLHTAEEGTYELMQFTGILDKNGKEIYENDVVSLADNITADDSLGELPNGWSFEEDDKYAVIWDEKLAGWVLEMDTKPEDAYNQKYMNHARGLLVTGQAELIGNIFEHPNLLK